MQKNVALKPILAIGLLLGVGQIIGMNEAMNDIFRKLGERINPCNGITLEVGGLNPEAFQEIDSLVRKGGVLGPKTVSILEQLLSEETPFVESLPSELVEQAKLDMRVDVTAWLESNNKNREQRTQRNTN